MSGTSYTIPCKLVAINERKIATGARKVKDDDGSERTEFSYEFDGWWATVEFDRTRVSFKLSNTDKPELPLTITLDPNR